LAKLNKLKTANHKKPGGGRAFSFPGSCLCLVLLLAKQGQAQAKEGKLIDFNVRLEYTWPQL
jgi:hypothetical protein